MNSIKVSLLIILAMPTVMQAGECQSSSKQNEFHRRPNNVELRKGEVLSGNDGDCYTVIDTIPAKDGYVRVKCWGLDMMIGYFHPGKKSFSSLNYKGRLKFHRDIAEYEGKGIPLYALWSRALPDEHQTDTK